MKIKITSDSTCDLTPELIKKHEIEIFPLYVMKGEETFRDGKDLLPEDIFRFFDETGNLCTTSAVSSYDYYQRFKKLSNQYDAVIHINISSDFSACYQNARNAAREFDNVYVIDSRNLSSGHGHIVLNAALMAESGMEAEDIAVKLIRFTEKVDASFILDRLEYLVKGGRCSSAAALGANLLHLKPCIEVADGKMKVCKKYKGSFEKCISDYVHDRLSCKEDIDEKRIFITHTKASVEAVLDARKAIEECIHFDEVIETNAGGTISSHCGPNTLGILFLKK